VSATHKYSLVVSEQSANQRLVVGSFSTLHVVVKAQTVCWTMSCSWFVLTLVLMLAAACMRRADATALRNDAELTSSTSGGCAAASLCCQGKNNTCRIRQHPNHMSADADDDDNSVLVLARRHTCYCDSSCVDLDDCCDDYKQTCAREFT